MARALIVVAVVALVAASVAAATTPKPDAHDRALAQQLAAKVESLKKLTATSNSGDDRITNELKGCKTLGKTPADSFAVVFAMLPVLLIDIVNEIRPILIDIRDTIAGMHPHNAVFRRWLAAEGAGVDQILTFDNHGKKIDYCAAVKVMLAKSPSDAADPSRAGSRPGEDQEPVLGRLDAGERDGEEAESADAGVPHRCGRPAQRCGAADEIEETATGVSPVFGRHPRFRSGEPRLVNPARVTSQPRTGECAPLTGSAECAYLESARRCGGRGLEMVELPS